MSVFARAAHWFAFAGSRPAVAAAAPRVAARAAERVKVLHLINGEHYSGAERVQDLLAQRLPDEGFDVGFACLVKGKFAACRRSTAPLRQLNMKSRFDLRVVFELAKLIRDEGYRVIHAHTPRTAMIGRLAAALTGAKLVYHVHSPTSRDSTRKLQNTLNTWIERLSARGAAKLIAVSNSLAKHMRSEGFGADKIRVAANGVPVVENRRGEAAPAGVWTLGVVALFRPRKGLEVLLETLAILKKQGVPVRLRAVGGFETAEYEQTIKALAAKLDVADMIDWVGFTRDVNAELTRFDLFVLPSLFGEGLPMVVLEAMAAGVPVVATKVEGVPEAIRDGQDGLLADAGNPVDLARQIRRLVLGEANWSALRESALARHAGQFSDSAMAAHVAQAYREVLA